MQPSYALLPATSYPKTVGGMCYAIIELTLVGLRQLLVTSQLQTRKLDTLSQHAVMTNHKSGKSDMQSQHA